ncbi:MAG: NAD(P)-dependent alcohol dehydrogenase [Cyanobacteria bacterium P01_F01_bin.4]
MKAIVQTEYGPPEVLSLEEIDTPVLQDNEVRVKIQAASVHAGDWHLMRGTPFLIRLMFGGLLKPKHPILGTDLAGQVEAVGKDVTQFKPGDEVFGELSECGFGAFAEYACAPEKALALKPANLTFKAAAAVPVSALAALQGLRDVGQLQPGQRVLIHGASGGVGSFAVQIAKAFGAEVTGVCSTQKVEMVRSLGADHVIDYTQTDVTQTGQRYDLMLDAAAYRSVTDFLPALTPQGTYVMVGGSTARFFQAMFLGAWLTRQTSQKVKCLASKPNQADLVTLKDLIEAGKLVPAIDRCYPLSEVPAAIRYLEQRQVQGKVAISV